MHINVCICIYLYKYKSKYINLLHQCEDLNIPYVQDLYIQHMYLQVKRPADKVVAKKTPFREIPVLNGPPMMIPINQIYVYI
jgi:hypothetical protein